ncbi:MAG: hypothetical protein RL662_2184 [Bacteroidota bacterium]|jgi:type IV secretory pathway VirB2 component (pilin)
MKNRFYLSLLAILTPLLSFAQSIGFSDAVNSISNEVRGALKGLIVILVIVFAWKLISKYREDNDLSSALQSVAGFGLIVLLVIGLIAFVIAKA